MLKFIQKTLDMGRIFTYRPQSYFDVTKQKDVAIIIDIFKNYPLNTHKYLNFFRGVGGVDQRSTPQLLLFFFLFFLHFIINEVSVGCA